uniref:Uncharacterized protein n=1 Tax=Rhizophora mucronata TaxID=61149 RepID=A0A2P2NGP6_RHIMU
MPWLPQPSVPLEGDDFQIKANMDNVW